MSRIDQNSEDSIILGKLIFNAYVWHVWAERNARIFRHKATSSGSIVRRIIQVVTTRILYLGIRLPDAIHCHWNVPFPAPVHNRPLLHSRLHGWRLSIVALNQVLVGIL